MPLQRIAKELDPHLHTHDPHIWSDCLREALDIPARYPRLVRPTLPRQALLLEQLDGVLLARERDWGREVHIPTCEQRQEATERHIESVSQVQVEHRAPRDRMG